MKYTFNEWRKKRKLNALAWHISNDLPDVTTPKTGRVSICWIVGSKPNESDVEMSGSKTKILRKSAFT